MDVTHAYLKGEDAGPEQAQEHGKQQPSAVRIGFLFTYCFVYRAA